TVEEVIDCSRSLIEDTGPVDGVALTGGEPLVQSEFLGQLLSREELPRPRLLETNGMLPDRLTGVLPNVDIVSMDIKLPSNSGEAAFWDEHERFLRRARGKVYIKMLVDAGTTHSEVERAAGLIQATAPETATFLQPIQDAERRFDIDQETLAGFYSL